MEIENKEKEIKFKELFFKKKIKDFNLDDVYKAIIIFFNYYICYISNKFLYFINVERI